MSIGHSNLGGERTLPALRRLAALVVMAAIGALLTTGATPAGAVTGGGFGAAAVGGSEPFVVSTLASDGPGSLVDGLSAPGRLITFGVSGTIHLPHKVYVPSDTTINGNGARVVLTGRALIVDGTHNVVIRHLARDGGIGSDDDGFRVTNGATDVWLDHLTLSRIPDEALEVSQGATRVTISWVHMYDQNRGILVGNKPDHSDGADPSHVTVHHSFLDGLKQRQPRSVRWAQVHAYNNVIQDWRATAMSAAQQGQLLSESNILVSASRTNGMVSHGGQGVKNPLPGLSRSVGDLMVGADVIMNENDPHLVFTPPYDYVAEPASPALATAIRAGAGAFPTSIPLPPRVDDALTVAIRAVMDHPSWQGTRLGDNGREVFSLMLRVLRQADRVEALNVTAMDTLTDTAIAAARIGIDDAEAMLAGCRGGHCRTAQRAIRQATNSVRRATDFAAAGDHAPAIRQARRAWDRALAGRAALSGR